MDTRRELAVLLVRWFHDAGGMLASYLCVSVQLEPAHSWTPQIPGWKFAQAADISTVQVDRHGCLCSRHRRTDVRSPGQRSKSVGNRQAPPPQSLVMLNVRVQPIPPRKMEAANVKRGLRRGGG